MATLGELLFYIATQQQDSGSASVTDTSTAWGITPSTIQAVARLLRPGEDEVCQHYAVKTIENICSQGGEWAAKFATQVSIGIPGTAPVQEWFAWHVAEDSVRARQLAGLEHDCHVCRKLHAGSLAMLCHNQTGVAEVWLLLVLASCRKC